MIEITETRYPKIIVTDSQNNMHIDNGNCLIDGSILQYEGSTPKLGMQAFGRCYVLQTVTDYTATEVGQLAFTLCEALHTVNLPECSVIQSGAFDGCKRLTSLYLGYNGIVSLPGGAASTFTATPFLEGKGTIYVPANQYVSYVADPTWSVFYSQIKSMPGTENPEK